MNPRMDGESFLDYILRWYDEHSFRARREYRQCKRVVQTQLEDVHAQLIANDGWETDAEMARRMQ